MKSPLVVIAGPTGVGKTAVAVALGQRLPIEVIGADSRQVYRLMDLGTGKPTREERGAVRHHLVDVVDPDETYQAARFRREAREAVEAVRERGRLPVLVGGTGLYIRALVRGLDPAPPADPRLRAELAAVAAREGRGAVHRRLAELAPDVARRLHPNDQVRIVRAFEILQAGRSPGAFTRWGGDTSEYRVAWFGLTAPRGVLARRLQARCLAMVAAGLPGEVQALLEAGYDPALPALSSIGYREFARVLQGELDPAEALRLMQRNTIRYARRQWTWFMREPGIRWIDVESAGSPGAVAGIVEAALGAEGLLA